MLSENITRTRTLFVVAERADEAERDAVRFLASDADDQPWDVYEERSEAHRHQEYGVLRDRTKVFTVTITTTGGES